MEILKIETDETKELIKVNFEHNNKKGYFDYRLFGVYDNVGIRTINFKEDINEDIYDLIHNWVKEHISTRRKIFFDKKELI